MLLAAAAPVAAAPLIVATSLVAALSCAALIGGASSPNPSILYGTATAGHPPHSG
ncbi:hypothetical protein GCM10009733_073090 [Nonomuraea maheshkhaliensis]|uniref:Uncharacterized protein n=1 Tax=Nonomuraea maheshkhaliensis TaxID=419590 RepID=A0ABN2G3K1_9ACTN